MREPALLSVNGVTLQYRTGEQLVTATYRVSFDVRKGDRFVVLGPSGCGKSTLLKAIGGYLQPVEGEMLLNGARIGKPGPDRAFVFQEFDQLLPWKTVRDNVVFALTASGKLAKKAATERALHFIDKVGLTKFADNFPHTLSGGMKQRVAIARAMAMEPQILLMDEPFAALDALTRGKMQEDLLELWDDTRFTVLFVTHSIPEAIRIGNRILLLTPHPGRAKAEINCDGRGRRAAPAASCCRREFSGCCSIAREPSPMSEERAAYAVRPEILHTPTADTSGFAVAAQPLGFWTRLYGNGTVRKSVLLVLLAAAWEIYARALDNPLLFPTFTATVAALARRHRRRRDSGGGPLHAVAAAEGLRRGARVRGAADGVRERLAHRRRPARDADGDVQPAAVDRAAAARADLVRPRRQQRHLRARARRAVGRRAEHVRGLPRAVADAAHGRPELRPLERRATSCGS